MRPLQWTMAMLIVSTAQAAPPEVGAKGIPFGSEILRTAQAAMDVVPFEWIHVSAEERERWCVVRIEPGEHSGTGFTHDGKERTIHHGRWTLVSRWSEEGVPIPKEGKYAWSDLFPHLGMRPSEPATLYSTLVEKPSLVLVRWYEGPRLNEPPLPLPSLPLKRPWDRILLLPPDWETAFPEAWKRQAEVAAVLAPEEPDWKEVQRLACDPNGPVALAAVQRLWAARRGTKDVAKRILTHAHGTSLAVLLHAIGSQTPDDEVEAMQKVLVELAEQATDAADVRGWGAGAKATAGLSWRNLPQPLLGRVVLGAARRRGDALGLDP